MHVIFTVHAPDMDPDDNVSLYDTCTSNNVIHTERYRKAGVEKDMP